MLKTLVPLPPLAVRARLMVRLLRFAPTIQQGLRSPHSPAHREWTAAARLPPPRRCTPLPCQGRRV
eukprot:1942794-Pleurochrysis_carterae.AAC.2